MKKFVLFSLITIMVLWLCSCTQKNTAQEAHLNGTDPLLKNEIIESDSSSDQLPQQSAFQTISEKNDENHIYFPDQDYTNWSYVEDVTAEGETVPKSYSELLESIGPDGLIVVGRAEGLRKGNKEILNTVTTFRIEKVLLGQCSDETIEVTERYYPVDEDDDKHIFYYGDWYTLLKDNDLVLLYLSYNENTNRYSTRYFQLPLPEDYLSFSDESLTELLDYYRNHKNSMKVVPPEESNSIVIQNSDGTETEEYYYGQPLIQLEKTDEEMIELMKDHILVQTAVQFKIKIWPQNHIRYTGRDPFLGDSGIKAEWNGVPSER